MTMWAQGVMAVGIALVPLAAGTVHRPVILILSPIVIIAAGLVLVGDWRSGSRFNISTAALFPAAFAILTAAQLIPLPPGLVRLIDPQGSILLAEAGGGAAGWRPLTLDPARTHEAFLRSVIAAVVFLATYHLAAKRRGPSWFLRAVAAAGVAAVAIGLGHRVFAISKIFGLFPNPRHLALLAGPFINANHNAEFLELATFVNIACARQATTQLGRLGWHFAAAICAGGAVATLSRSSIAALAVGTGVIAAGNLLRRGPEGEPQSRFRWLPAVIGLLVVCAFGLSIGAGQILDRFRENLPSKDGRLELWRDSLLVLKAHPMGIGRGAFGTVYPVYRTLGGTLPVRFEFVENESLQMLIDFGIFGFALLVCAAVFPVRSLLKYGRRDPMEIALIAAIAAVGTHTVTDFGVETLGVLLPLSAVLGVLLGRNHQRADSSSTGVIATVKKTERSSRISPFIPLAASTVLALFALSRTVWSRNVRDFDTDIKAAPNPVELRATLAAAREAHPLDYYYPLVLSTLEPLVSQTGQHSPRLRMLNQALLLCPNCPDVHLQIARAMWRLGRRPQALAEWAAAAKDQPDLFLRALNELTTNGARPGELMKVARDNPQRLLEVARFLLSSPRPEEAEPAILAAAQAGAPELEVALLRAQVKLLGADGAAAQAAVNEAKRLGPTDSRVALLDVAQTLKRTDLDSGATALSVIEHALDRDPDNLDLHRKRIEIVSHYERWSAAERSIMGFKQALQVSGRVTIEANLAAAGIYLKMGRTREAFAEYRIATTADPSSPQVWRQFAQSAEATRHYVLAREAYAEVMRLAPDSKVNDDIRRVDSLRSAEMLGSGTRGIVFPPP